MPATSGQKPQSLINKELLSECDILVGVFCSKFGSPTEEYESGTVEEIETFINLNRKVILYFLNKPVLTNEIDPEELKRINQFKAKYKEMGIYKIITEEEIGDSLKIDLTYNLKLLLQANNLTFEEKKSQGVKVEELNLENTPSSNKGNWWSDESITDYINEFLQLKNFDKQYEAHLTFYENVQRLKGYGIFTESTIVNILHQAKAYAFNKKYGNFSYNMEANSKKFLKILIIYPLLFLISVKMRLILDVKDLKILVL